MNERIEELAIRAGMGPWGIGNGDNVTEIVEKFAELMVQEHLNILQQEWYRLNDLPEVDDEMLREIGMRVGKKSEIVLLQALIKKHFGVV
jgi:hypothetical protein